VMRDYFDDALKTVGGGSALDTIINIQGSDAVPRCFRDRHT